MNGIDLDRLESLVIDFAKSSDGQRVLAYVALALSALFAFHHTVQALRTPASIIGGIGRGAWWGAKGLAAGMGELLTLSGWAVSRSVLWTWPRGRELSPLAQDISAAIDSFRLKYKPKSSDSSSKTTERLYLPGGPGEPHSFAVAFNDCGTAIFVNGQGTHELLSKREHKMLCRKARKRANEMLAAEQAVQRQLLAEHVRIAAGFVSDPVNPRSTTRRSLDGGLNRAHDTVHVASLPENARRNLAGQTVSQASDKNECVIASCSECYRE